MMVQFKALLFDLDGTLADSSGVVREIMAAWCLKHQLSLDVVLKVAQGTRTEDTIAQVAPHLCAKTEAGMLEQLESSSLEGLMPVSGAERWLARLPPGSWAIATSSSRLNAERKLEACGLPVPEVLITAESVVNGKPHPEAFLKAAQAIGVEPQECLVFEDTDHGVQAALAADCKVILVGSGCVTQHANSNILGRISSFDELLLTDQGELQLRGQPVATKIG